MRGILNILAGVAIGSVVVVLFFLVWLWKDNLFPAAVAALVAYLGGVRLIGGRLDRWGARREQRQKEAMATLAVAALAAEAASDEDDDFLLDDAPRLDDE